MISIQLALALIMCAFVGGISGYIGSLMVTKRMALVGGALGHLTMPGVALAMLYNFDVTLGALFFLLMGIIVIWFLEQRTNLPIEALTAVIFATSLGISFLFLPEEKTIQALIGDISHISPQVALITITASLLIFFTVKKIFPVMVLTSISSDIASSMHINVSRYNLIYLVSIVFIVALGVRIVGGLMTAALLAIPACTSKNLSKNLFQYAYGSMFLGGLACVVGTLAFAMTGLPVGPLIILFSSFLFLVSLILKH